MTALPRETAERWSTCQRVGCGHGPEHHVDDTAGRCHLCGCPHYLGRIEDDDEQPFPAPSEPSDKAMVLALSRELKDLREELDLVSEQRDMIAGWLEDAFDALHQIANTLGSGAGSCTECKCEGCSYEMWEAARIASAALDTKNAGTATTAAPATIHPPLTGGADNVPHQKLLRAECEGWEGEAGWYHDRYEQLRAAAEGVLRQLDDSSTVDPWAIERLRGALDTNAAPPGQRQGDS